MKMENDILEVEKKELDLMLKMFLKQYRYFNNNKMPKEIVFADVPNLELTEDFWEGDKGKEIPIKYGGVGVVPPQDIPDALPSLSEELPVVCESCRIEGSRDNPIGFLEDGTCLCYSCAPSGYRETKEGDDTSRPLRASGTNKPASTERGSGSGESESATDE